MWRVQHAVTVQLLDRYGVFESHDYRSRHADGAERFVSLIQ
jgi:hypothetical protein